jgi:hypothetical protein
MFFVLFWCDDIKINLKKEKKESTIGKKKKKRKVIHCEWKKKVKKKGAKKSNTLWITIVIHSAMGVGEQWFPHTL